MARNKKMNFAPTDKERRMLGMKPAKKKRKKAPKGIKTAKEKWLESHDKFLKTKYWGMVRAAIHERDKICQKCSSDKRLHVHHKTYVNYKRELSNLGDLVLLCSRCHKKEHSLI